MDSNTNSVSDTPMTSASQVILHAEPVFFIGNFVVAADQVKPHPSQRLLCQEWVDSLHQRFQDVGIDRAAHPIKVLLEKSCGLESLTEMSREPGSQLVPELPKEVALLVYHGQHRIAACLKMEDVGEHWWYAEVYRQGTSPDHC